MEDYQSLNHTKWDCKYHVVWIPKCRRKVLMDNYGGNLGGVSGIWAVEERVRLWKEDWLGIISIC